MLDKKKFRDGFYSLDPEMYNKDGGREEETRKRKKKAHIQMFVFQVIQIWHMILFTLYMTERMLIEGRVSLVTSEQLTSLNAFVLN